MQMLELAVFLSRLIHLSSLISLVIVYVFSYKNYKERITISKLSMIPIALLILSFFVVLMRPTQIPGVWFVIALNTLYGGAWWLSVRGFVFRAVFK